MDAALGLVVPRQRPSRSSSPSATRSVQGMQPMERKPSATSGCSGRSCGCAIGAHVLLRPFGERIDLDAAAVGLDQRQIGAPAALDSACGRKSRRRSRQARAASGATLRMAAALVGLAQPERRRRCPASSAPPGSGRAMRTSVRPSARDQLLAIAVRGAENLAGVDEDDRHAPARRRRRDAGAPTDSAPKLETSAMRPGNSRWITSSSTSRVRQCAKRSCEQLRMRERRRRRIERAGERLKQRHRAPP